MFFMISTMMSIFLTSLFIKSPLILGALLMILAMTSTIILAFLMNSWFSFMIFLIYISGLLVLFSYFSALSPNQFFYFTPIFSMTFMFYLWSLTLTKSSQIMINPNLFNSNNTMIMINNNNIWILMILFILLLTLISIVKMLETSKKSMRPFMH